ncbi:uncharacterized [Tachysurus ichikawai]
MDIVHVFEERSSLCCSMLRYITDSRFTETERQRSSAVALQWNTTQPSDSPRGFSAESVTKILSNMLQQNHTLPTGGEISHGALVPSSLHVLHEAYGEGRTKQTRF